MFLFILFPCASALCLESYSGIYPWETLCVTDVQRSHTQRNRQKREADCDWYCLHYKHLCQKIRALPSRLITLLPVTLVTSTEWLSSCHNSSHCIRVRGKKMLLLRLSRWMRKNHQPGAGERSAALLQHHFVYFSQGFVCLVFVAERQKITKLWVQIVDTGWDGKQTHLACKIRKCPSFNWQAVCLSGHCCCYWLFTAPL